MNDPFLVRNVVYGVEDSLVSTSGVVVGMSLAGIDNPTIIKTGIILVLVESLSMAFGSFVSEDSFMTEIHAKYTWKDVLKYSMVMFMSYMLAGSIPLLPFAVGLEDAWQWATGLTILGIFGLMYAYKKVVSHALILTTIAATILTVSIIASKHV